MARADDYEVILSVEVDSCPVPDLEARLTKLLRICCQLEGVPAGICFGRLVDDQTIHQINRDFRAIDSATDVLSFPSIQYKPGQTAKDRLARLNREKDPDTGLPYLGDFALSLPTALRQAREYGHSIERELCYLSAHSFFHLMGYDHMEESDKRLMRRMEELAMTQLGEGAR